MPDKKQKDQVISVAETENSPPTKKYSSFDEYFQEFAIKNGVNLKWKESVKKHLKAIDCLKDQSKWLDGMKNFGL